MFVFCFGNSQYTPPETWETPFGFGEHGLWYPIKISSLKPGMLREGIYWPDVEKEKGKYVFPEHNRQSLNFMNQNRIEPLYILAGNNIFYSNADVNQITIEHQKTNGDFKFFWGVHTQENIKAFVNYAKFVVKETKGRAKYFEIWNEIDRDSWVPMKGASNESIMEYTKLLKAVYPEIKKVNPDAVVLAGIANTQRALELILKYAGNYIDGMSIHPYVHNQKSPEAGGLVEKLKQFREVIDEYRPGLPILVTEFGYVSEKPNNDYALPLNTYQQAQYLVRGSLLITSLPNIERSLIYVFADEMAEPMVNRRAFGVVRRDTSGTTKLSYDAIQTLIHITMGHKLKKTEKIGTDGYHYMYESQFGDWLHVIWKDGEPEKVFLTVNTEHVIITNLLGKDSLHETKDGKLEFWNTQDVIYIRKALPHEVRLWHTR